MRVLGTLPGLLSGLLLGAGLPAAARAADADCEISGVRRVVAVADVHGAYDNFVAVLRMAGLIDESGRWTGGAAHLVQTGDVLDRGPESRKAMEMLMRLESEARKAGGRVHALLGNHEVMNLIGDLRYVSAEEYAAFLTRDSRELRERYYRRVRESARERAAAAELDFDEAAFREKFLAEVPLGFVEMRQAFAPDGHYGRWLLERKPMVRIDGVAFLHGGVSPAVAPLGCSAINEKVRKELQDLGRLRAAPEESLATRADGPLWYRGLAHEDEASFAASLDSILSALGVRALVVGHTPTRNGRIGTRFGGRVVTIDVGLFAEYGGHLGALEIGADGMVALYPSEKVKLGAPAAIPEPVARPGVSLSPLPRLTRGLPKMLAASR